MSQEDLIGKEIVMVYHNANSDIIAFESAEGDFYCWEADGGCCCRSWFEHLNGLDFLLGQTVNKVIERDMPEGRDDPTHDYLRFYGWTLETSLGRTDLEMRNASNGYYGGNIYAYVGELNSNFKLLTEDF